MACSTVAKGDGISLAVIHKFMAKHLEEDNDKNIFLVGTMINTVAGIDTERDGEEERFRFHPIKSTAFHRWNSLAANCL